MRAEHMKTIFAGLSETSKNLLAGKLSTILSKTIVAVNADLVSANPSDPLSVMTPKPELIFEAFRKCPVENVRVVLIGQDPYIRPGEAHGLSFSVPAGVTVPPSLRNIYKCLLYNKLIRDIPKTGDLTSWASQGVLMLNSALTTRLRTSNAHANLWSQYTDAIISELSALTRPIIFILLGGFAQEKRSLIDSRRHMIFEWGHPSNLNRVNTDDTNPKNFKYCNVFSRVNDQLSLGGGLPINWDPSADRPIMTPLGPREMSAPTLGTATGASVVRFQPYTTMVSLDTPFSNHSNFGNSNNTKSTTENVFGIADGLFVQPTTQNHNNTQIEQSAEKIGVTSQNTPYIIRDWNDQDPQCYTSDTLWIFTDGGSKANGKANCVASYGWYVTDGEKIAFSTGIVSTANGVPASNNRGELTAILSGVEFVHEHYDEFSFSEIIVVSDSEYSIKSITQWIYTWEKDLVKHADKKNLDLIRAAKNIVDELKKKCKVTFKHINSHQDPPSDSDSEEWFMWKCNDIVDGLCNKSLGRK